MLPERFSKTFHLQRKKWSVKVKSSTENVRSIAYESFILELYFRTFHFGISLVLLLRR